MVEADRVSRMAASLEVDKSPSDQDSLKNCAVVSTIEPLASGLKPDEKGYVADVFSVNYKDQFFLMPIFLNRKKILSCEERDYICL